MQHRSTTRPLSLAILLRVLMVVSLWQGPTVWGHDHSQCPEALTHHVQTFHGQESCPFSLGWHWHFSIPELPASGFPQSVNRIATPLPVDLWKSSFGTPQDWSHTLAYAHLFDWGIETQTCCENQSFHQKQLAINLSECGLSLLASSRMNC